MAGVNVQRNDLNEGSLEQAQSDKLAELVLYVASKCCNDEKFGAVKLVKILYFADFSFYWNNQRSITGTQYMRLPQGPVPRRMLPIQHQLIEEGKAELVFTQYFNRTQKRLLAHQKPNLSLFTAEEIATVDDVIRWCCDMSATALSELSHNIAWRIAGTSQETIPYQAVYLSDEDPTEEDQVWAESMLKEVA